MIERDIFVGALQKENPAERKSFLDAACGADHLLRSRIEGLLKFHEQAGNFLNIPAMASELGEQQPPGARAAAPDAEGGATVIVPSLTVQAGVVIDGRYKLLQQIGEGGMGSVWMAEQIAPFKRFVAFKVIKEDLDSHRVLARFEAERQALALMNHPHIARILDAGTTATGRPYFIMDLVKGVTITEFCDSHQLPIAERLDLFIKVCHAVQHAHQKGIIHRDLKPSNILVESHDGNPVPKIIDFGLAKALHQMPLTNRTLFTGFGAVLGTPLYMSPEQAEFSAIDVDTRADIYALGVILYELLTGSTPLEKQRVASAAWDEIRRVIREEEPPRPSTRLSSLEALPSVAARRQIEPARLAKLVRGDLDWIAMKALSKERDRRYATASAFAEDIAHFRENEPVAAGPPTMGYRLRKLIKRHRGRVAMGCLLLAVMIVGMAGTVWGLFRARLAEQEIAGAFANLSTEQDRTRDALGIAERNRLDAEEQRDQVRKRLSRQYVEKAVTQINAGNPIAGLPSLVEALKLDEAGQAVGKLQRLRLGAILQETPELVNFWPEASCATLHPDGKQVAVGHGHAVRLITIGTNEQRFPELLHQGQVSEIHFLPGSDRMAVICNRFGTSSENLTTSRIWETTTGQPLTPEVQIGNSEKGASDIHLAPDGSTLFAIWQSYLTRYNLSTEIYMYATTNLKPVGVPFVAEHEEENGYARITIDLQHRRALTLTRNTPGSLHFVNETQLWDLSTGAALFEPIPATEWIFEGRFDPQGTYFVLIPRNQAVTIHNAVDGKLLHALAHPKGAWKAAFSPDSKLLATIGGDQLVRVWDVATGAERLTTDSWSNGTPGWYSIAFTPDGASLQLCGTFGIVVRDVQTGREQLTVNKDERDSFLSVVNNPDGIHIATAGSNGVRLWRRGGGPCVSFLPHGDRVVPSFTADGRFMMTTGNGPRVWDLARRPMIKPFSTPRNGRICDASIESSGDLVALLDEDGRIQVRDSWTGSPKSAPHQIQGEWEAVRFSPGGRLVVTLGRHRHQSTAPTPEEKSGRLLSARSEDYVWETPRCLQTWDATTGQTVGSPMLHRSFDRLLFHPDGESLLVAGSYDDQTGVGPEGGRGKRICELSSWNLNSGRLRAPVRVIPHHLEIISFSEDGRKLLVSTSRDDNRSDLNAAQIWDGATLEPVCSCLGPSDETVIQMVMHPDATRVLTVSKGGAAQIWETTTGMAIAPPLRHVNTRMGGHEPIGMADFSPDGRMVVTVTGRNYGSTGEARVWDVETGLPVTPILRHGGWVRTAAFSSDQTLIATISVTNFEWEVRIWEIATGLPLIRPVKLMTSGWAVGPVPQLSERPRFSIDGTRLLIPTSDGLMALDIEQQRQPVADLELLATILSGHEIDVAGGEQPVSEAKIATAWGDWRRRQPNGRLSYNSQSLRDFREHLIGTCAIYEWWGPLRRLTKTLLKETPYDAWVWKEMAQAAVHMNDWAEAEVAWKEVLRREFSVVAAIQLGESLAEQQKFAEAAEVFARAWKRDGVIEHGVALAWSQWLAQDREGYQKTCSELRARQAEYAGMYNRLSAVAFVCNVPVETVDASNSLAYRLEEAVTFDSRRWEPDRPLVALAIEYVRLGKAQDALNLLNSATNASDIKHQIALALALAKTHEFVEAQIQFTICRESYHEHSQEFHWQQRALILTLFNEIEAQLLK